MSKQASTETHSSGHWDAQMADWYVDKWGDIPLHRAIAELAEVKPDEAVIDIGCGSGSAVQAIAKTLSTGWVIGIDPTPRMIEIAQAQFWQYEFSVPVTFIQTGAEQLPAEDNSIDLVLAINTLHHWQDVDKGLNEVLRVLKPGGRFVVIDDLWEEQSVMMEAPLDMPPCTADQMIHHDLKDPTVIAYKLSDAGFSQVSNRTHQSSDIAVSIVTAYK